MHCELFKVRNSPVLICVSWSGCVVNVSEWENASEVLDRKADKRRRKKARVAMFAASTSVCPTFCFENRAHPLVRK